MNPRLQSLAASVASGPAPWSFVTSAHAAARRARPWRGRAHRGTAACRREAPRTDGGAVAGEPFVHGRHRLRHPAAVSGRARGVHR